MTHPRQPNDPTDSEEFDRTLSGLVSDAEANGIDIEGAYDVRTPRGDRSDYTVEITVIQKRFPGANDPDERRDSRTEGERLEQGG